MVVSITIIPLRAPAMMPLSPVITASTWGELDKHRWMMSHFEAMSCGDAASFAPMLSKLSTGARLRLPKIQSSYPPFRIFFAIPWPMKPTPIKPITGFCVMIWISLSYRLAVMPPSTNSVWPFTKLDASADKNTHAPTNSSTSPQRPAGVRFSSHAENSGSATRAALSGVLK